MQHLFVKHKVRCSCCLKQLIFTQQVFNEYLLSLNTCWVKISKVSCLFLPNQVHSNGIEIHLNFSLFSSKKLGEGATKVSHWIFPLWITEDIKTKYSNHQHYCLMLDIMTCLIFIHFIIIKWVFGQCVPADGSVYHFPCKCLRDLCESAFWRHASWDRPCLLVLCNR